MVAAWTCPSPTARSDKHTNIPASCNPSKLCTDVPSEPLTAKMMPKLSQAMLRRDIGNAAPCG